MNRTGRKIVWVVTADCGDYYCEGEHLLAVALSLEEAEKLAEEARGVRWTSAYGGASGIQWPDVSVEEITIGDVRKER